jgi:hypothetical protein
VPETNVWLIDTPGFDDTFRTDAQILEEINRCLALCFHKNAKVTGVLYVHAITEERMRGSAMTNLRMFRQVVGMDNMHHCRMVTTKWSRQDKELSKKRIGELSNTEEFWKPLVEKGAQIVRFHDSVDSAKQIIEPLAYADRFHMNLVKEYNIEKKDLRDTGAGKEVCDQIESVKKAHKEELDLLRQEWDDASKAKDVKMQKMIEAERKRLEDEMQAMKDGQELLRKKLEDEKKEIEAKVEEDRLTRLRDKERRKKAAWQWTARGAAALVGGAAIGFTAGAATPFAIQMMVGLERMMDS